MKMPPPAEQRWTVTTYIDASGEPDVTVRENMAEPGTYILSCDCREFDTKYQDCPHVSDVMAKRLDGQSWVKHRHPDTVFVPIYSDFGVMVDMHHEEGASLWTVHVHLQGDKEGEYRATDNIGYLSMSEGRRDLRSLVLEWLHAQYQLVEPCDSKMHKREPFSSDEKKRRLDATNPKVVKDVYSILSSGECFQCQELSTLGVPEV